MHVEAWQATKCVGLLDSPVGVIRRKEAVNLTDTGGSGSGKMRIVGGVGYWFTFCLSWFSKGSTWTVEAETGSGDQ